MAFAKTDRDRVVELHEQIVTLSQDGSFLNDPYAYGLAIGEVIQGYLELKSLANVEALSVSQKAMRLFEEIEDSIWLPRAYNIVSTAYSVLGMHHKGLHFLEKQYALSVKTENIEEQASALHNIGVVLLIMEDGDLDESRRNFEQSILAFERVGNAQGISIAYANMVMIELRQNNPQEALKHCAKALPYCVELSQNRASVVKRFGEAKAMMDLNDEAEEAFLEALEVATHAQDKAMTHSVNIELGKLYVKIGAYEEACKYLDHSLAASKQAENFVFQSQVFEIYVELYEAQGDTHNALAMMKAHMEVKEKQYALERKQQEDQFEKLKSLEIEAKNAEIFQLKNQKLEQMVNERTIALMEKTADLQHTNNELELASQRKDAFLAAVSHELRTPLNIVMTRTQAIQKGIYGPISDRLGKVLQGVHQEGKHLSSLIDDVLDISLITSGKGSLALGLCELEDLVAQCMSIIDPVFQAKNLTKSVSIQPPKLAVEVDERRVKQILINLLSNAVKFTEDGGAIELKVVTLGEDIIEISVKDTGIGIAKADQENLFAPFSQVDSRLNRKYEGTGLGLALVKQFAELHGGRVAVESEVGVGSTFFVYLPQVQTKVKQSVSLVL